MKIEDFLILIEIIEVFGNRNSMQKLPKTNINNSGHFGFGRR